MSLKCCRVTSSSSWVGSGQGWAAAMRNLRQSMYSPSMEIVCDIVSSLSLLTLSHMSGTCSVPWVKVVRLRKVSSNAESESVPEGAVRENYNNNT